MAKKDLEGFDDYCRFLLMDRITKIKQIVGQYGEENFYISFSGGKDSTVLHHLIDLAIPNNKIPRVYANTGIDLNMVRDFVFKLAESDERICIIKPSVPIKPMLEQEGYPFKNKTHSLYHERFKRLGRSAGVVQYLGERTDKKPWSSQNTCPKKLRYQFEDDFKLKISDHCCVKMKEEPLIKWSEENHRPYNINGIMRSEEGRRAKAQCLAFRNNKLKAFQPLAVVDKEWEEWFIKKYNIEISPIYLPPYNFPRTGCKGCPFARNLQHELDVLEKYFPEERKQCEYIWKPIYEEYRRIGYRLKKPYEPKPNACGEWKQMSLFD